MKCPKVLCFKTASRRIILAFSFLLAVSLANPLLFAQFTAAQPDAPGAQWQKWFYSQRSYGLGYIPENALANAVAQRDTAARRHYQKQDTVGAAASAAQWVSLGPSVINSPARGQVSGRLTSIAIDPINPANVYVASAGGGVWKSSNKGNGWIPLTDNLPSLASGAVAVDPFSSEVWYGTGELDFCRDCYYGAGVYRSPDGGVTWTRVAPDIFLSSATSLITFDPHNQGTIFMGRSSALWKSTDDGQTWAS